VGAHAGTDRHRPRTGRCGAAAAAAGLGQEKIAEVAAAIVRSAERTGDARPLPPTASIAEPPANVEPTDADEPEGSEPSEPQS
jgi:hypothetical protein